MPSEIGAGDQQETLDRGGPPCDRWQDRSTPVDFNDPTVSADGWIVPKRNSCTEAEQIHGEATERSKGIAAGMSISVRRRASPAGGLNIWHHAYWINSDPHPHRMGVVPSNQNRVGPIVSPEAVRRSCQAIQRPIGGICAMEKVQIVRVTLFAFMI